MADFCEYPKWIYSASGALLVGGAEEEAALGEGWFATPDLKAPEKPEPVDPVEIKAAWAEFAGMLGIEVDGRWRIARLKDEVKAKLAPPANDAAPEPEPPPAAT